MKNREIDTQKYPWFRIRDFSRLSPRSVSWSNAPEIYPHRHGLLLRIHRERSIRGYPTRQRPRCRVGYGRSCRPVENTHIIFWGRKISNRRNPHERISKETVLLFCLLKKHLFELHNTLILNHKCCKSS